MIRMRAKMTTMLVMVNMMVMMAVAVAVVLTIGAKGCCDGGGDGCWVGPWSWWTVADDVDVDGDDDGDMVVEKSGGNWFCGKVVGRHFIVVAHVVAMVIPPTSATTTTTTQADLLVCQPPPRNCIGDAVRARPRHALVTVHQHPAQRGAYIQRTRH